ncbi:MAG: phosphatase PAP2 family protein [Ginsengibacter sp.]
MNSRESFIRKYLAKLPLRLILLLALFIGALLLFVLIIHEVLIEKEVAIDNSIFKYLSLHVISNRLTGIMKAITYCASAGFLQMAYGALLLFYLFFKNWKRMIEIFCMGLGGFIINYVMKLSFHRLRPPNPLINRLGNFSFPSGHATSAFIFYGLLAYLVWKTNIARVYKYVIGAILILFSLLIGFSRVYLRVHYPSDVAAGFCIGFAWLLLSIWLFEGQKKKADQELKTGKPA